MNELLQAQALFQQGKREKAKTLLQKLLKQQPDHAEALRLLGYIAGSAGDYQSAAKHLARALEHDPSSAEGWYYRAVALQHLGQHAKALDAFNEALRLYPNLFHARHDAGLSLSALQRFTEAVESFDMAIALDPLSWSAYYNRGIALGCLGRHEEELISYDKALTANPDNAPVLGNRGVALAMLGRHEEALPCFERALQLDPHHPEVLSGYGATLVQLARYDEALAAQERALKLKPNLAKAHFNRAQVLLVRGDFAQGWQAYEWRWKTPEFAAGWKASGKSRWTGQQALRGKSILLRAEQGLGDTIQFCRYAPLVAGLGAEVILEVQPPLVSLLRSLNGVQVIARGEELPDADYECPLMSLPGVFHTDLTSLGDTVPYLAADKAKAQYWKARLGDRNRPRVGLVWNGGFRENRPDLWSINARRNISLRQIATLNRADIAFFSLQKGEPAESELREHGAELWPTDNLAVFTEALRDFSDTAALIANLDLVISVDTSTAHLAGAMGKPVWILNRYDTCWRWFLDHSDSPWYPSATLYRQPSMGDWDSVLDTVTADLAKFAESA
ncbi:tetratricopeptide repeat protein [Noviherbaspirillum pedocola]|uniref:Tetratricopeptide repeat protein n=1 Tax=Noviherbaspirillum pedocola TaxID=2801341 RepID=A0A934SYY8_9BURK|nr:tetratricopeptide repeat protein [Noviherbaspirillum pedocola]MBK4738198.1 tetratricopeptide repeat protein [Noviherbaspirillum pedocola]